jgi:hypothetical protein
MKKSVPLFLFTLFMTSFLAFPSASAQGEWKWANYWTGNDDPLSSTNPYNYVVRTAFDEDGNVYVFGSFGGNATLYDQVGNTHFSNITSVVASNTQGTALVKFDSLGNYLWSRIIKNSKQGDCRPYDMILQDGKIVISGQYSFDYSLNEQLWFLDTLVTQQTALSYPLDENHPPYTFTGGDISFVSILDLEGNILENHFVKIISRDIENRHNLPLNTGIGSCPMCMDSDGNLYIATGITYGGPDTLPWTVLIDEDTNRMYDYYLPGSDEFSRIRNMVIFKLSPTFDLEWTKLIVEHTEGLSPYIPIDTVNPNYTPCVFGMSVDSENNVYLSGYLMDMWMTDQYNQYPIHIYWDSTHYAIVDDYGLAFYLPFIIKYDSNGNVLWANQAFVRNSPSNTPNYISWTDNQIYGNSVYLVGWIGQYDGTSSSYYFDNENNALNVSHSTTYFVKFNKDNGLFENADFTPGAKTNLSYGSPTTPGITNNHVITMVRNYTMDDSYRVLCYFNADGGFVRADTIRDSYTPINGRLGVVINTQGDLLVDFISQNDLQFTPGFSLEFTDHQHSHAVIAYRSDPSILEPYPEDSTAVPQYDERLSEIRLYPNPATDHVVIESPEGLPVGMVAVTNESGQLLFLQPATSCRTEISVRDLPSGLYVAHVSTSVGSTAIKFVVRN